MADFAQTYQIILAWCLEKLLEGKWVNAFFPHLTWGQIDTFEQY